MKQKAHAWIALRALKLIDESNKKYAKKFVEFMSYYLSDVWDGAWLPDSLIKDMKYGHIYKMDSSNAFIPNISEETFYLLPYDELREMVTGKRLGLKYSKDSVELEKPYNVFEGGGNLPDRVIAVNHSIADMLKMGDYPIRFYLKKKPSENDPAADLSDQPIKNLSKSPNFSARQIALTFFIASHYISDGHMPLHCDLRDMDADVGNGTLVRRLPDALHDGIEEVWEDYFPDKETLTIHDYTTESISTVLNSLPDDSVIELDKSGSKYAVSRKFTVTMPNEFDEMENICRIYYAVSRKWVPQSFEEIETKIGKEKCKKKASPLKYDDLVSIIGEEEFIDVTNRIFHDAVEAVARIWLKAWNKFLKDK